MYCIQSKGSHYSCREGVEEGAPLLGRKFVPLHRKWMKSVIYFGLRMHQFKNSVRWWYLLYIYWLRNSYFSTSSLLHAFPIFEQNQGQLYLLKPCWVNIYFEIGEYFFGFNCRKNCLSCLCDKGNKDIVSKIFVIRCSHAGTEGPAVPPIFRRSINPIPNKGGRFCPPFTTDPQNFLTFRHHWGVPWVPTRTF